MTKYPNNCKAYNDLETGTFRCFNNDLSSFYLKKEQLLSEFKYQLLKQSKLTESIKKELLLFLTPFLGFVLTFSIHPVLYNVLETKNVQKNNNKIN